MSYGADSDPPGQEQRRRVVAVVLDLPGREPHRPGPRDEPDEQWPPDVRPEDRAAVERRDPRLVVELVGVRALRPDGEVGTLGLDPAGEIAEG